MRFAVIEAGFVTNVIEAEEAFAPEGVKLVADHECQAMIGGTWSKAGFGPAPAPEMSAEEVAQKRADAYRNEADPLFFKWRRGEADRDDWIAKVDEIKARFAKD